ncbi:MAG: penicillin-binding protein 2 [Pseudobutyrivibrio sp.]|nr:penicillin-binding protein 2 [Pseudobutyrivibrio sp.]
MKTSRLSKRKEIYIVASIFVLVFVVMIVFFAKFINEDARDFVYNQYNSRFSVFSDDYVRGTIYSSDKKPLATTKLDEDKKEYRDYPYERLFSHAIGYTGHGMTGLEAYYSFDLLKSHNDLQDQIDSSLSGKKILGDNIYTTLNVETQKAAYEGLGLYDGAVIAIEPDTGKVIAMVSKPDFDPNSIDVYWDNITGKDSSKSALLNRATMGNYPPGSTFKIVSTLAYLRDNNGDDSFSYNCNGEFPVDDYTIHCSSKEKHGKEDLKEAFSNSCNSAFAKIGVDLDRDVFMKTAQSLMFNENLPTQIGQTSIPEFNIDSKTSDKLLAQTAIGQGQTVVSPLYMCMLVSAIANDGVLMEPYMVDKIVSADGQYIDENLPSQYRRIMTVKEANTLSDYMESVVQEGTARKVDFKGLKVYGKTGTAEYSDDKEMAHSWFVGYATDDNGKELAVAVIMEGAGYGSKFAAPLAAKVFDAYFN